MAIYKTSELDQIFHALSDGTRRSMFSMLSNTEKLSASELARPFKIAQPTASKHLKVLEKSNLVLREISGRSHYFRIRPETARLAEDWFSRHREFWISSLNRLEKTIEELEDDI